MASCTDNISQDNKVDHLSTIASSKFYHNYGQAITKNLNDTRKGLYDLDAIMTYVNENHANEANLCELDFTKSSVPGIDIYLDNVCSIHQALESLRRNLPAYTQLDKEEKVRVHEIYAAEFRKSTNIYFNLNN
ncbi:MAG: hypothetical protein Sapg2KO_40050 [Saprospiraceae bacterium]